MISPKDERLNFKEKGWHPRISRVLSMTFLKGKTAPEKRMKDKELLKIPKQVRTEQRSRRCTRDHIFLRQSNVA